jgi:serine/threonine protein phosphatase PrpC
LNIGDQDKCIGLFDGNGDESKDFSQIAGNFCMDSFQDEWAKIRNYVVNNKIDKLHTLIKNIYESVDEYLDIRLSNEDGGCSALLLGLVNDRGNTYCFSANIGNISCILYENNTITHLWENHIPDNIDEWERYCNRISANKRKQFVYNTINCYNDEGLPIGLIIETDKYNNGPIPIFEYKNNIASVIKENINLLQHTNIPLGGNETVRNHLIINEDGNQVVDPKHAHENTGATVEGKIKITRTLGNYKIRKKCYLDMECSFYFKKLNNKSIIVLGTDGFYNLWKYEDVRDNLMMNDLPSSEHVQALYNKTFETATNEKYKSIDNRYPMWDDMAFMVVKINNKEPIDRPEMIHTYDGQTNNNDDDNSDIHAIPKCICRSDTNNLNDEPNDLTITDNKFNKLDDPTNKSGSQTNSRKNKRKRKKKNKAVRTTGRHRRQKRRKARNPKNRR